MWQIANYYASSTWTVDQNSFAGTLIWEGITGMNFEDWQVKSKIDTSYLAIEDQKKKAAAERKRVAEEQFNISLNAAKQQREALLQKWNLNEEEMQQLQEYNKKAQSKFSELDSDWVEFFANQANTPADTQKVAPTVPVTPTTPIGWNQQIGSNGATPGTVDTNPANIYDKGTTQVYDATQIPAVLKWGKIQPAKYFAMNGLSWNRDAKRIALEAGIQNYNGMPWQNYAIVDYLEKKKSGGATPEGGAGGPNRQFDKIATDDNIPNRFTQEDRETLLTMNPDEQKKYIQKRNLDDLRSMLPGNVALINKVFGTNYTSDDLTGGLGRATILGTGKTQAGMEVERLINNLRPGQADKFMNKGMEFDNSQADNVIIDKGDQTVQMGRRQLLQGMVDSGQTSLPGTSIDANDQAYIEEYKGYKAQKLVADRYNELVSAYNGLKPDNVLRNKALDSVHQYVNNIKATNPDVYKSLQEDLDRFPQFANSGDKIPTIADMKMPWTAGVEQGAKVIPWNSPSRTGLEIAPPKNNIQPPAATIPVTPETIQKQPTEEWGKELKVENSQPKVNQKSWWGWYSNNNDADARYGYSSNSISKG